MNSVLVISVNCKVPALDHVPEMLDRFVNSKQFSVVGTVFHFGGAQLLREES